MSVQYENGGYGRKTGRKSSGLGAGPTQAEHIYLTGFYKEKKSKVTKPVTIRKFSWENT